MREVESASARIADRHGNDEFAVSPSRLSDIETKGLVPSIFRLYSLAIIYRFDVREMLSWYGIDLSLSAADLNLNLPPRSHVTETLQGAFAVEIPTRLDPAFDPRRSANLSRMVEQWGLVPLAYLAKFSGEKYTYGYIGSEDFTMYPLLPPGTFLQVDESRNKVVSGMWRSELERPIYFVETREGYTCCWCSLKGDQIVLQPHPLSPVADADVATSSGSGSDRAGGWYRAQARGMASGRVPAGFETRIERACSTELKCRAEPPLRSCGSRTGRWLRNLSKYSLAVICSAPLEYITSSRKRAQRSAQKFEKQLTMRFCQRLLRRRSPYARLNPQCE